MGELSFMQVYWIGLAICVITGWAIQFFDSSDDGYGFAITVSVFGLFPAVNIVVASIAVFILAVSILGVIASVPTIIRRYRK